MKVLKIAATALAASALVATPVAVSAAAPAKSSVAAAKLGARAGVRSGAATTRSNQGIGTPLFLLFAAIGIGVTAAVASGNGKSSG